MASDSELTFYFDESVELAVSEQLAARGLDVVSAHSLGELGDSDANHLERATGMGRVLCTYDADFLRLAAEGAQHAGIVYAQQRTNSIGSWVRGIEFLHATESPENLSNRVEFLPAILQRMVSD